MHPLGAECVCARDTGGHCIFILDADHERHSCTNVIAEDAEIKLERQRTKTGVVCSSAALQPSEPPGSIVRGGQKVALNHLLSQVISVWNPWVN